MNNKYCFSLKDKTNVNILVLYCAKFNVKIVKVLSQSQQTKINLNFDLKK